MFFLLIGPRSELFTMVTPLSVQFLSLHLPVIDIGHPGGRLLQPSFFGTGKAHGSTIYWRRKTHQL